MVNQFKINLNRQEGFVQRQERIRKLRERITLTVVTVLLLGVAFMTFTVDQEMRGIVKGKQMQLDKIIADIDSLQKAGQNVSKEDVMALARLDKNRVLWTKKFVALADRLPEKMAVTALEFDRGKFTIRAISQVEQREKEFDKVKDLMDQLQASPMFMKDFRDIKFTESKRTIRDEQELLDFTVTCTIGAVGAQQASKSVGKRSRGVNRSLKG